MATFVVKSNLNVTVSVILPMICNLCMLKYEYLILPSGEYINITDNCYSL